MVTSNHEMEVRVDWHPDEQKDHEQDSDKDGATNLTARPYTNIQYCMQSYDIDILF